MPVSIDVNDLDRLQRRALDKIALQIEQEEEQERQAEELRKREVSAEIARQQSEKDQFAIAQLSELKPLYVKRKELAERAAAALADFCQVEEQIKIGLAGIDLSPWAGTPPTHSHERREALRQRAGLSPRHWRIELRPMQGEANRMSLVALSAVVRGFVSGDGLRAAGVFTRIDTDDGV